MAAAFLAAIVPLCACGRQEKGGDDSVSSERTMTEQIEVKALEKEIGEVNGQLPMDLPDGLKMTRMELKDDFVTTTASYPSGKDIVINSDSATKAQIIGQIGEMKSRLKDLGIGVRYIYQETGTGKETVITITSSEL